jgi:hypothetical protein
MVVTTDTPSSELAPRLAARNAVLESRVLELEAQLSQCGGGRKRKRAGGGSVLDQHRHHRVDEASNNSNNDSAPPPPPPPSKRAAARQREAAACAEISRLKAELETIKAEGCPGHLARERRRAEGPLLLPRRALTLAGFWNVLPNDLLEVTPALIATVEARGGTVLRREGMQTCFRIKERRVFLKSHELGSLGSVSFML